MASDGGRTTASHVPRDVVAGRYRIDGRLGRGGMGTVWRATDELLRRSVAIKEMHLPVAGLTERESGLQRDRALREARSVARIQHPHVVVVYDVVEQDGRPWIVMELVDGRSLADVLTEDGPLPPREAARVVSAVAGALLAAHDREIQHRDVKPANVLIEDVTGRVVLTDFGIARIPGSATISETGGFVGSPEYTAPERMSGRPAGPESDLWSLGALLCAAVDGQSPFHRESIGEIVHAVSIDDIKAPASAGPLLPVVHGLLDRDPASRMAAAEVMTVLTAYARDGVEPPERPTPQLSPAVARTPQPGDTPELRAGAAPGPAPGDGPGDGPGALPRPRTAGEPGESGEPAGPARPAARRRGRWAGIALLTAVAVGAGALAATLLNGGDGSARGAGPAPRPSTVGATAGAAPPLTTPSATPSSSTPPLLGGYQRVTDPNGFSVALLPGSVRDEQKPRTYYWSPDRDYRFGEREQAPDPRGAYALLKDQDEAGPGASGYQGYRQGYVSRTTHHGYPAALWEFTYDGFGDGRGSRVTIDLCWTEGDRMFDIWVSGPYLQSERTREIFDEAVDTFQAR